MCRNPIDFGYPVLNNVIHEPTCDKTVSTRLFEVDMPRVKSPNVLSHFTTITNFKKIIAAKAFYLSPLINCLKGQEFETYVKECNLSGYLKTNSNGDPIFHELMNDIFFMSFFRSDKSDGAMWYNFAGRGTGVCLKVCVTPRPAAELRELMYAPSLIYNKGREPIFKKIERDIQKELDHRLSPSGISRMCGFYLPRKYMPQREVRLMVKRHKTSESFYLPGFNLPDGPDHTITVSGKDVWPIALNVPGELATNHYCNIEIREIVVGKNGDLGKVLSTIEKTKYAFTPISQRE